jgi:energy-coupling factor transporter ATP-binding protein EcfA2
MICVDGDQQSLGSLSELSLRDITDIQGQHNTNWLCGRTTETLTLLKTYETILQNPNRPLSKAVLVVHGESGSGKTSLVESLREPVSASHGYFCSGKFFQQTEGGGGLLVSQEPYSAVLAAFSDLCDLVLQSTDFDSRRRDPNTSKRWSQTPIFSPAQYLICLPSLMRIITKTTPILDFLTRRTRQSLIDSKLHVGGFCVPCRPRDTPSSFSSTMFNGWMTDLGN